MSATSMVADRAEALRPGQVARAEIDRSCRVPVLFFAGSAVFWLVAGSLTALVAAIKMHTPGFLTGWEFLTFGRVRPVHLNMTIFGWASMAGIATLLWLQARLARARLPFGNLLIAGGVVWNVALMAGLVEISLGRGTSVEWIEIPLFWALVFAAVFAVVMAASLTMFGRRKAAHVYVSQWYLFGAVLWFPFLYLMANVLIHGGFTSGTTAAAANWWFAHNVLGLWLTPIGLATVYYLIPKVIGAPIHSYHLSLLGFWSLALFYNWAGTHHLIGGPLPAWLVTVGIVGSVMMFVPVVTVGINHHMTMLGHFRRLKDSPTLRFVVFGGMSYTVVSVQGSLTSLRSINEVNHFTHYTIAHAHLGVYAFFSMVMFGALYYMLPRLSGREWGSARLIKGHFWASALGIALYWGPLTIGGWVQGLHMNNPDLPFLGIVADTVPYLWGRTAAGVLMTVGHCAFGWLVLQMLLGRGEAQGAALAPATTEPREVEA
jgi:cytochrome c oxidase cbb3-type subunit 1